MLTCKCNCDAPQSKTRLRVSLAGLLILRLQIIQDFVVFLVLLMQGVSLTSAVYLGKQVVFPWLFFIVIAKQFHCKNEIHYHGQVEGGHGGENPRFKGD